MPQSPESSLRHLAEPGHLVFKMSAAEGGDAVRAAAFFGFEGANPAAIDEAGDSAVKSTRTEVDSGEVADVEHHAVAVFIAVGKAGEDEEAGIDHSMSLCGMSLCGIS